MARKFVDLIFKKECYDIIGAAYDVYNSVGYGHKENFYQKALAKEFQKRDIRFKEQLRARVKHGEMDLGIYILDFLVYEKIVVEIKKRDYFSKKDIDQVYAYLKATNLQLGVLIHFMGFVE